MSKKIFKNKLFAWLLRFLVVFILLFLITGIALIVWIVTLPIPDFNTFFNERIVAQSTKIYDNSGEILLYNVHDNVKRTIIPFEKISDNIKQATIAIEDADFYNHKGVQPQAILRALWKNILTRDISQGGSTITQQLIKNTLLTQDKKISRKIKEALMALKLEQVKSKDEILNLYLNEAPYGGNIYGIEEASKGYFSKSALDLTIAEAAYLAALPQAPSFLSPEGNNRNSLENRKNLVLQKMKELNYINQEEYEEALVEEVEFNNITDQNIKAPHFVFYILNQIKKEMGEEIIENGGFNIITTLDWETQQLAETELKKYSQYSQNYNIGNAGLVAIDPRNGHILSMVGSFDYFDTENNGNFNIALAKRQPGSAFKPFIYATAFNKGYTPETVVFDLETEFSTNCPPECYSPKNFDGTFSGPINLRNALAQSKNIPSVKTFYLAGMADSITTAESMGITTLDNWKRYGLTLVLGGGEVTLLDMTGAFGVFANDGVKNETIGIIKITDNDGNIIKEWQANSKKVLPANTSRLISDILSDNEARTPVFGANSNLNISDKNIAVKTGTTNNSRDVWIIGYTPSITVGLWAGNNDNTPTTGLSSSVALAPIWNSFMRSYLSDKSTETFPEPEPTPENIKPILKGNWLGGETYLIDSISGKLANEHTPSDLTEEKTITKVRSILYWVDKNNPLGPKPKNPENDPQFNLWNEPVLKWASEQGLNDEDESKIPTEYDNIHTPENKPKIDLDLNKKELKIDENLIIEVKVESTLPFTQADLFINNVLINTTKSKPINFNIELGNLDILQYHNQIKLVIYDQAKNKAEKIEDFTILDYKNQEQDSDKNILIDNVFDRL
ncbi:MAG: transglycosylase domain-containing protein [Patescibacteria group bacterium]